MILKTLFPHFCILCAKALDKQFICPQCYHDLPWQEHACIYCAKPVHYPLTVCMDCEQKKPPFIKIITPFLYEKPIDFLIKRFKFHDNLAYGNILAQLLKNYIEDKVEIMPQALLPVPLHYKRLQTRGFNQALELCYPLARYFKLPIIKNEVIRTVYSEPQAGLQGSKRVNNIKQQDFVIKKDLEYQSIAIVDDVVTTTATVKALTRVLQKHGVKQVQIWALARA